MLRKRKKIGIIVLLIIVLMTMTMMLKYIYSGDTNIRNENTEVAISSEVLMDDFHQDEDAANKKYKEKVIEVDGVVKEVTFLNNRNTVILYGANNNSYILCDMASGQEEAIKSLQPGQSVKVKGICKGFLKDAILLNCIVI